MKKRLVAVLAVCLFSIMAVCAAFADAPELPDDNFERLILSVTVGGKSAALSGAEYSVTVDDGSENAAVSVGCAAGATCTVKDEGGNTVTEVAPLCKGARYVIEAKKGSFRDSKNLVVYRQHDFYKAEVTPATCDKPAVYQNVCRYCGTPQGDAFEEGAPDESLHRWGNYVYNNDATSERDGTETRRCEVCGKEDTRVKEGTKLGSEQKPDPGQQETPEPGEQTPDPGEQTPDPGEQQTPEEQPAPEPIEFPDVAEGKWYKEYVDYVSANGLMNGNADGSFNPDGRLTRAEFVQILANLAGVDTTDRNVATEFADVSAGKWFTPAVKWAVDNKIVNGISPTEFKPNANIERQQICTMVVRYATDFARAELPKTADKITFADEASIGNYAKDAVAICQQAEIVNGMGDNKFEPKKEAERSQAAKIITVFHKIINAG